MDIKILCALLATSLTVISYFPYIRDIFKRQTRPHVYTWLIWLITQGTATAALLYGGGGWGSASLIIGTALVFLLFLLSLKFGTKNITKSDMIVLTLALLAIIVWWLLDKPLLAVLMASAIDGLGYIPTYRKSWHDPRSETVLFWVGMVAAGLLSIVSLSEYNLLTTTYLVTLVVANIILVVLLVLRRKKFLNVKG